MPPRSVGPLAGRELACGNGFAIVDVRCRAHGGAWSDVEEASAYVLVLPRSGCFRRRANGVESVIDPSVVYFREPGEEQQVAHPVADGDVCTSIRLDEPLVASVWGGAPTPLPSILFSSAELDLAHRLLLASCAAADAFAVEERVFELVTSALRQHDPRPVESGRPASVALRRRLVADARERLALDPTLTLRELARVLAVSPYHLSRLFTNGTGVALSRYRNRVRVREALERIAAGERSLARLAGELGFADHAHLTRTIAAETGLTPSALRPCLTGRSDPATLFKRRDAT